MVVTAGIGQRASVAVTTLVGFPVVVFCAEVWCGWSGVCGDAEGRE